MKAELVKQAAEAGLTETRANAYAEATYGSDETAAAEALTAAVQQQTADKAALVQQGLAVGLNETFANQYAENNIDTAAGELAAALDGIALQQADEIKRALVVYPAVDLDKYAADKSTIHHVYPSINEMDEQGRTTKFEGNHYIYHLPYSIIIGSAVRQDIRSDEDLSPDNYALHHQVTGYATAETAIPTLGKAIYTGKAFSTPYESNFSYTVDFGNRTGSGKIVGFTNPGTITLDEGNISKVNLQGTELIGISSTATAAKGNYSNGNYTLGFFGTQAQEVAGIATFDKSIGFSTKEGTGELGFGGTRGDITQ